MTEYQECFGEMSIPQLREELEYQQSLGYNLGDSVCAYIVDRIAMLKRIEKKPITITVSEYLKFVTTEKSETIRGFIHPFTKVDTGMCSDIL